MKTSGAITGLAGLATLGHGTTAFLLKDPNSLEGCDLTCKQRILYTNIDSAARIGVSLAEDAYNSAEWCVSEDSCSRTIDSTCSMITRRLIEAAHDGLENGNEAEFWDIAERSMKRATYWGADWGSRVLNRTSEEKGINSVAMERLNRTLKNFPYAPERSVVNKKALEEEMRKPLSGEDSSAEPTPSMQLKNLAPSGSVASPDMLDTQAEGGGGICGIVPQYSTHWDESWVHVTVDLCAQSTHTRDSHPTHTSSHRATTKSAASAHNSTNPSVPATTTQDATAASNQTTGSLVTAILPNGSTAIVTAILPAATSDASSTATHAVGLSGFAGLSSTSALHSTASKPSEKSTPATPTTGKDPTVTTKSGRPAGTPRPSANTTALTTTSSANEPSSSSLSSSESSVRATRSSSHIKSTTESRTSFSSRTTSDAITASPGPTTTLSASGGTASDGSSSPSKATASTQSSSPSRTSSASEMPLSSTANGSSSSHVGSTTSAAPTPIHSDSSSLHSNTERTVATVDHSSAASSAQSTAASSPSDSGPQPSQSPSHGSSGGDGDGGDDDDDDDHLGLGLGVGLGIGSLLVGGAVWALGNYLHTRKMLGIPLKDSVLEGFSFLKHIFRAKDEAVRRMANPNSSTERSLREPGQRAMDLTNYRYERLIQNAIENGHDILRQIPDMTGEFNPERADTLPDGTRFDNGSRRTFRIERFSARSGLLENVYVRPADVDYTHPEFDRAYHPWGYRRFVWTNERGIPLPPFNYNNGTSTGRYRYFWAQPSELRLIDLDQEWQNVRSRFVRPRDVDGPVIQYLSKPDGAAIGDTLSSQPILQLDGESIIVDAVARVQDQFGDTVAAEMIAPEYSSEKLRNLLNERKYLVTRNASGSGDVELVSREDFLLNRPGKPVLRKPLRVSDESDYGWGHGGPTEWPGHGLDIYGYPIPGYNGTSPTYSSLLSTVTPSIETTYLSTDYTTRTHYVNFTTSYESTEYSTKTHMVDFTTQYESTALSTHFVTPPMLAPTTLATIGRCTGSFFC